MKSSLFIPQKIKVGYQNREGTYTKKLAYVIYYDEQGKLRKEWSWEKWRDQNIPFDDFDNEPTEGFVLNKKVGGYRNHYDVRQTYVRVYDPRGFEFEISVPNLLYILENTNSIKGKGLDGQFVYSWDGKDLVLLPVDSPDYKELNILNNKRFNAVSIKAKDLKIGGTYLNKNNVEVVYLGKFQYYDLGFVFNGKEFTTFSAMEKYAEHNNLVLHRSTYRSEGNYQNQHISFGNYYWFEAVDRSIKLDGYYQQKAFKSIPKGWLIDIISEKPISDYADRYDSLESDSRFSPVDYRKNKYIPYTFEEFVKYMKHLNIWRRIFFTCCDDTYIEIDCSHHQDDTYSLASYKLYRDKGFDYEKHYSIKELFEIFHPCYKETYLENGRLYQRIGYE